MGRAIALALAKEGANVTVCSRTASEIEAVADEVRQLGRSALTVAAAVLYLLCDAPPGMTGQALQLFQVRAA
jgi:7-alpha-hydroxysteroid dehydrogenase